MNSLFLSSIFLFKENHLCIQEEQFRLELYSHPDYPSLLALTDTLSLMGIKYTVGKCDYNDLLKNKQSALTLLISNFIVILKVHEKYIVYYDTEEKLIKRSERDNFEEKWNGSVLYMINESSFSINCFLANLFHKYREWLLIVGMIFLLIGTFNWKDMYSILLLFTKVVGMGFCFLLAKYHLNNKNTLLNALCKNGSKFSCEAVLNSKYSQILGISFVDIGMVYFGTTLSILIYCNIAKDIHLLFLLLEISLCTLPVICVSIFCQRLMIKKWCPLCLSTMAVLLMEALISAIFFFNLNTSFELDIQSILILLSFTLLFGYAWSLWSSDVQNRKISIDNRFEFLKIKKDNTFFKEKLNHSQAIECYQSDYIPVYGETNDAITLTIVMNIHCMPCAKAHSDLMKLFSLFPEKLKIYILFTGNPEDENDNRNEISLYLLQVFNQFGIETFEKELSTHLHSSTNRKPNINFKIDIYPEEIKKDYYTCLRWIQKNRISETPTIFINGRKLPSIYQIPDLKYFISDL